MEISLENECYQKSQCEKKVEGSGSSNRSPVQFYSYLWKFGTGKTAAKGNRNEPKREILGVC